MSSSKAPEQDYRSRFEQYKAVEAQKDALISELLDRLEAVQGERDVIKQDLEVEQDVRRRLQRDVSGLQAVEKDMNQGRFVVVLIDADADIYVFHEKFLARGEQGGQEAAEEPMLKVRQYLQPFDKDADTVTVTVKAFANVSGLAQACVRNGKLKSAVSLNQFVIGFNRRHPLFDFVDVGPGKEEADNKLKGTLEIYAANPQCQQILLGCYHDHGYIPFLRKFDKGSSISGRITLIRAGPLSRGMESLAFKKTDQLNSVFSPTSSTFISSSPNVINSPFIVNSGRLGPIIRDSNGKRIDKILSVNLVVLQRMKELNLCGWHFLREDCTTDCRRSHSYQRPLSPEEFDAVWLLTRAGGLCYKAQKNKDCYDDKCIYRHGAS